ncbi:cellulose binding domain-containing protein, partial [Spirillospora sp. NPDC049652]
GEILDPAASPGQSPVQPVAPDASPGRGPALPVEPAAGPAVGNPTRILDEPLPATPAGGSARRPLLIGGGAAAVLLLVFLLVAALSDDRKPAAAHTPAPSGRPTTGPSPAASATTPSPSTPARPACAVAYAVTGQWPGGFQAQVRITNLGTSELDGWRLSWTFGRGERITQLWNGAREQSGADVTVIAADYNRRIAPHGTAEFGFLGTASGSAPEPRPDAFTLDGTPCRQA